MLDAIKKLLDSNVINEDTHTEIQDAWNGKLNEARDNLRVELREEFAQRYEHDKTVMVEALDKMVTEGLKGEIAEFNEEKSALAEDRVKFTKQMTEHASKFNNFLVAKLSEEIKELRKDRKIQTEGMNKLNKFVAKHLAKEIREFAQDKQDVVETKVKLVAEARNKLTALKKRFVSESAKKVQAHVTNKLSTELTSLHEDIKSARENSFGRRIFEAFATEFTSTHLNENAEIRKLQKMVNERDAKLTESANKSEKLTVLAESRERKIRMITESNKRNDLISDLLGPLNDENTEIMQNLLENVQTSRLNNTFEKYLPAVLANRPVKTKFKKRSLTESKKAVTGNKTVKTKIVENDDNIIDIKKLAGL